MHARALCFELVLLSKEIAALVWNNACQRINEYFVADNEQGVSSDASSAIQEWHDIWTPIKRFDE